MIKSNRMPFELKLFIISIISLQIYPSVGVILPSAKQPLVFLSMTCIVASLITFILFKNGTSKFNYKTTIYFCGLIISSVFMLIMGLYGEGYNTTDYVSRVIITDIISLLTYFSGVIFINTKSRKYLFKTILILGFIGIVNGIVSLIIGDFSVLDRSNAWSDSYILWFSLFPWSSLVIFYFLKVDNINKFSKLIVLTSMILYFVLSFLFLKRVVILELFLVIIILLMGLRKLKNFKKIAISICVFIGITIMFDLIMDLNIRTYINMTISRFSEIDNIASFNRLREYTGGTRFFNTFNYLFGVGIGGVHYEFDIPRGNMHITWLNYLFKGGVLLFAVQLFAFYQTIKSFIMSRKRKNNLGVAVTSIVIFIYTSGVINTYWGPTASSMVLSMMLFSTFSLSYGSNSPTITTSD